MVRPIKDKFDKEGYTGIRINDGFIKKLDEYLASEVSYNGTFFGLSGNWSNHLIVDVEKYGKRMDINYQTAYIDFIFAPVNVDNLIINNNSNDQLITMENGTYNMLNKYGYKKVNYGWRVGLISKFNSLNLKFEFGQYPGVSGKRGFFITSAGFTIHHTVKSLRPNIDIKKS